MIYKLPHIFYGWWIVAACFVISLCQGGFIVLGFTAFFEPISKDLGWSYTQIALAISFRGVEAGILSPIVGLFVDRQGPRWLMFGGTVLIGTSLLIMSQTSSLGMFYGAFILLALGMSGVSPTTVMTAVANWFRKKAGIATGIINSGFALGGLLVPLEVSLIDAFDWRTALIILGIIMWAIGLPLSLLVRHKPEQYGYLPDGAQNDATVNHDDIPLPETKEVDFTGKQALKSRAFWHIGLAMTIHFAAIGAYVTHVIPCLSSVGISRSTAALVAMVVPLISIAGRLGSGWLTDRFNKKRVTSAFIVLSITGIVLFGYTTNEQMWLIVPFTILLGMGWGGTNTSRMTLIREYFGRRKFGTIFGFQMGMTAVGMILGPLFAGWVFDTWSIYQPAWMILALVVIIALIIMATTPPTVNTKASHSNSRS